MLAADADLEAGLVARPALDADSDELADAVGVDGLERVRLQQALFEVGGHHPALDVVAAEAEGHLGEVVRPEGEEVRLLGDLVRPASAARGVSIIVPIATSIAGAGAAPRLLLGRR